MNKIARIAILMGSTFVICWGVHTHFPAYSALSWIAGFAAGWQIMNIIEE